MEDVVSQYHGNRLSVDELLADDKGLCQSVRAWLYLVGKLYTELMTVTERPLCIKDCGVSEAEFMSKVDELSYKAFEDQCTTANPVYPLVSEIKELYREAYYGE